MQDASELGEQKDMCLSISEVSELTGITPSNLRFFEEEGILDIPRNGAGCRVFHRKEMEELLGMSDRLIVLSEHRMAGELGKEEMTQNRVLDMASGDK